MAAFVAEALKRIRLSLALGTAIQFKAVLRQKDVIGEGEPIPEGDPPTGIITPSSPPPCATHAVRSDNPAPPQRCEPPTARPERE